MIATFLNPIERELLKKKRRLKVTDVEKAAWHKSDVIAKTIEYLYKTDLKQVTRTKMIRDIIKDNLIEFYIHNSNTKEVTDL